jgi:hypothetical protein
MTPLHLERDPQSGRQPGEAVLEEGVQQVVQQAVQHEGVQDNVDPHEVDPHEADPLGVERVTPTELNAWRRGFTPQAEIWNGRLAMLGLSVGLSVLLVARLASH